MFISSMWIYFFYIENSYILIFKIRLMVISDKILFWPKNMNDVASIKKWFLFEFIKILRYFGLVLIAHVFSHTIRGYNRVDIFY